MTNGANRTRIARIERLVRAARRIADANDVLGRHARSVLPESTGLSPQGVELALMRCLETNPSEAELAALCASVPEAPRAHVLLSANVFVAAFRAIALAAAASDQVLVRASRRELNMPKLLWQGSDGAFELAEQLTPRAGDHYFVYGSDATLAEVSRGLAPNVTLHAHGSGYGVAVIQPIWDDENELRRAAIDLAQDVVLFDQRGCLSPRIALVLGAPQPARYFAIELAAALTELERNVPRGRLDHAESAEARRWQDTLTYAAELIPAGAGAVSLASSSGDFVVPPAGRHVQVLHGKSAAVFAAIADSVTVAGVHGPPGLTDAVRELLPGARLSELGQMQRPPFDGPVDRRPRCQSTASPLSVESSAARGRAR